MRNGPSTETASAVALEVRVDASPETVFDFFVEPDKVIQWMGLGLMTHNG